MDVASIDSKKKKKALSICFETKMDHFHIYKIVYCSVALKINNHSLFSGMNIYFISTSIISRVFILRVGVDTSFHYIRAPSPNDKKSNYYQTD